MQSKIYHWTIFTLISFFISAGMSCLQARKNHLQYQTVVKNNPQQRVNEKNINTHWEKGSKASRSFKSLVKVCLVIAVACIMLVLSYYIYTNTLFLTLRDFFIEQRKNDYRDNKKGNMQKIDNPPLNLPYKKVIFSNYTQYSLPAIQASENTFSGSVFVQPKSIKQEKSNVQFIDFAKNNHEKISINFWKNNKKKSVITIFFLGRYENIQENDWNKNTNKSYYISVNNKKILAQLGQNQGKVKVSIDVSDAGIPSTDYMIYVNEKGYITQVDYVYYLKGNGLCACASVEFLKIAMKIDKLSQLFAINLDTILEKGLKTYKRYFKKEAQAGEATSIDELLARCDLPLHPSVRLDANWPYIFNNVSKQGQATSKEAVDDILYSIEASSCSTQYGILRNGPEAWCIIYKKDVGWFIYDSHGKKGVGDQPRSFLAHFTSTSSVANFIWSHSTLRGIAESRENIHDPLHHIYFYWLLSDKNKGVL
ncbi:MAG: hypothetical protein AAF770_01410 [Bacteroidota bacterium]